LAETDIRTHKTVDAREPDQIRSKLLELGWYQEQMYTADYAFFTINYKKVGVERKTVSDLCQSIGDRLSSQFMKMLEHYDVTVLIIEGHWGKAYSDKISTPQGYEFWTWTQVWNYLRTWQDRGLTLELTVNEGHTIKRLNELYAYYMKNAHTGGITRAMVSDSRILALQCGGIGEKLGKALLEKFGSLKNIANAGVQDFLTVEKIGDKKATALWNHFNKDNHNE
jgi:ERCC4-type nuclease